MEHLYGWLFTYNIYSKVWMATISKFSNDLTNNFNSPNVIKSSSIKTLIEVITKFEGNITKVAAFINKMELKKAS